MITCALPAQALNWCFACSLIRFGWELWHIQTICTCAALLGVLASTCCLMNPGAQWGEREKERERVAWGTVVSYKRMVWHQLRAWKRSILRYSGLLPPHPVFYSQTVYRSRLPLVSPPPHLVNFSYPSLHRLAFLVVRRIIEHHVGGGSFETLHFTTHSPIHYSLP